MSYSVQPIQQVVRADMAGLTEFPMTARLWGVFEEIRRDEAKGHRHAYRVIPLAKPLPIYRYGINHI